MAYVCSRDACLNGAIFQSQPSYPGAPNAKLESLNGVRSF